MRIIAFYTELDSTINLMEVESVTVSINALTQCLFIFQKYVGFFVFVAFEESFPIQ